jgi:hypothetical protein
MENVSFYEPPVGGRINSPKLRGVAQFVSTFEGLPDGVTRFDLLKLVKNAGPIAGFTPKMIQLLEYYILLPVTATGQQTASRSCFRPYRKQPSTSGCRSARSKDLKMTFSNWRPDLE